MESVRVQCDVLLDPPNDLVFTWYFKNGTQIMATNEETSTPNILVNNEFGENGN